MDKDRGRGRDWCSKRILDLLPRVLRSHVLYKVVRIEVSSSQLYVKSRSFSHDYIFVFGQVWLF